MREIEGELELSRRMAAIGRLTSGVGHEVKNPINAIVVHLELLRNKLGGSDEKALRHLEIIQSEIQRLDRVVQTLVDFSRPVELQLQEQDLRRVVSSVLMLASAEFETRNVYVQSDLPDRPVMAKVDADLLKQAVLNIVLNGAQAMTEGGTLNVRLAEDGRMALLSIHDEGGGIPDDIRDKIFDLYFTTKKDGSGIGLAMTYRIVQLHNGSVEVESGESRNYFYFALSAEYPSGQQSAWILDAGREQLSWINRSKGAQGMRAAKLCSSLTLLVFFCTGCLFHKSSPPQQAQAPPLQTGKGTLNPPKTAQQQPKTETPLASPLPAPSAQNVPLPPPPAPQTKKAKHKAKPPATKPAETAPTLQARFSAPSLRRPNHCADYAAASTGNGGNNHRPSVNRPPATARWKKRRRRLQ